MNFPRANLFHVWTKSGKIGVDLNDHAMLFASGEIEQMDGTELLVRNGIGASGSALDVQAVVFEDLANLFGLRVIGEERSAALAIGEEIDGVADPHGIEIIGVFVRNFFDVERRKIDEPNETGVTAVVVLPGALPYADGNIREAFLVRGVRAFGGYGKGKLERRTVASESVVANRRGYAV